MHGGQACAAGRRGTGNPNNSTSVLIRQEAKRHRPDGRCLWVVRRMNELLGLLQLVELLHQARLAPGGVVLVDDALARRVIQIADRLLDSSLGLFGVLVVESQASLFDGGAGAATRDAIVFLLASRTANALDSGLDVSQRNLLNYYEPDTAGAEYT